MSRCPVKTFEGRLVKEGVLASEKVEQMASELDKEIHEAVVFAQKSPFPSAEKVGEGVYFE